jgi:predicted CopG family antitoxin
MDEKENQEPFDAYAALTHFVSMLDQIEKRWAFLYDEIGWANDKQNDLVHNIENDVFKDLKRYKKLRAMSDVYLELHDLRKYRRSLKDEQEALEPIYKWYISHKAVFIDLHKIKDTVSKIMECQENWIYIPRAPEGTDDEVAVSRN